MTASAAVKSALQRLADAVPVAWRHDPIFRGTSVAATVTLVLFLLRVVGPHASELDRPDLAYVPPAFREFTPRPGAAPPAMPPPADVPKIAPGHPLSDVAITSTPDGDRFGTFKPGKTP